MEEGCVRIRGGFNGAIQKCTEEKGEGGNYTHFYMHGMKME
jgi:hypothetical protein